MTTCEIVTGQIHVHRAVPRGTDPLEHRHGSRDGAYVMAEPFERGFRADRPVPSVADGSLLTPFEYEWPRRRQATGFTWKGGVLFPVRLPDSRT